MSGSSLEEKAWLSQAVAIAPTLGVRPAPYAAATGGNCRIFNEIWPVISRSAVPLTLRGVNVPLSHVDHVQTIDTTIDKSEMSFRYFDATRRNGVQGANTPP
jgi:hypothetical protein